MVFAVILGTFLMVPSRGACLPQQQGGGAIGMPGQEMEHKEISVSTTNLENGVTGVTGKVYINASPRNVWSAITDYENQKHFIPKLIDSGLISDNGNEQIMFEKGRTGILFFKKTVYIKLSIRGDYLQRLSFRQLDGDFEIYEGDWILDRAPDGKSTILTFNAKIKPDFFAPSMFVSKVQRHDLPMVLAAMKKRAESADSGTIRTAGRSMAETSGPTSGSATLAD